MQIGLIGKANVGKSTFFNAATDLTVETGNYPFTTIKPNVGICYARQKCDWSKNIEGSSNEQILVKRLSGLGIKAHVIDEALAVNNLKIKKISSWNEEEILSFTKVLRRISRPLVIAANKADISTSEANI